MSRRAPGVLPAPVVPIERFALACGATLLVSRREGAPVMAVRMHLRGGHSLDPETLGGCAYLTGALLDQGTAKHDEQELAVLLEPAGGDLQGDANGLSGSIACEHWKLLLGLFAEVLCTPAYPAEKVERQKARLLERFAVEAEDPRPQSARLFSRLVYGDHWLGRPARGTSESVKRIKRADLAAHHRRHWCGSRAVIAVCGDIEPALVRRLLDRALARWPKGADLPPPDTRFPAPGRRCAAFPAERQQVHLHLGHLGVRRADPDYEELVVLDHVLGSGPGLASRVARRLRDELGLAYSVHASITSSASMLPGTFRAYIGTSPEHVHTAVQGFLEELRRIRSEPVGKAELELAKSYLVGALAIGFERAAQRVGYMISAHRFGLPPDHLLRIVERYRGVTAADVLRVARAHLRPDEACLSGGGPVRERDLAAALAGKPARASATRRAQEPTAKARRSRVQERPRRRARAR